MYLPRAAVERLRSSASPLGAAFVCLALLLIAACSPLAAFDALVPAESGVTIAGRDIPYGPDPRQRLDVYAPDPPRPGAPVVLFIYGGAWNSGDKNNYGFVGNALAAQGFVTVVADYRLVPQVRFPAFVEDIAGALRWTNDNIARYGGDPKRIHLLGHSAGAYNVVMAALDARFLRARGLGTGVIKGVAGLAGPYDFLPLKIDVAIAAFQGTADLAITQPVNFVRRSAPPAFLATGADDTTVRPRNTASLAAKLAAAGATVETKTYPGVGHVGIVLAIANGHRDDAPVLKDVVEFFSRH